MSKINYKYAFSEPHRITLCRPSASEKYLADVSRDKIDLQFSYRTLRDTPPLTWKECRPDVTTDLLVFDGSEKMEFSDWYREESGIPCLEAIADDGALSLHVSGIATRLGLTVRLKVTNRCDTKRDFFAVLNNRKGWVISNQGWIDGVNTHLLLSQNDGRADRVIAYGVYADEYILYRNDTERKENAVPMPSASASGINPMRALTSYLSLNGHESKTAYIVLPFALYWEALTLPSGFDCERAIADAKREWMRLLRRSAKIEFSDSELTHCFQSCLADLFVMRERSEGKYWGITCGTEFYRSINSSEPILTEIVLDRLGYHKEFEKDIPAYTDGQDPNGCWAFSKGWEHEGWGVAFNKASAIYTHYLLTGDIEFLRSNYDRMLRSTRFNHKARQSTKNDPEKAFRGLMPRGMGDCGLMNGSDYYGVFYPGNCQSVAADLYTLMAAEALGRTGEIAELRSIYEEASRDIVASLRNNMRTDGVYTYIPGIATSDNSSLYGCLFSFYPCRILDAKDPIVQSTLQYVRSKKMSEGGLPVGTGWMRDGLWVAMALDNFAGAYLRMGMYDAAAELLYPVLNHASRFVTYCEERGAEAGAVKKSGDKQHLWTPLSVCAYILDAICFADDDAVHLCAGLPRELMGDGKRLLVDGLCTEYGRLSLKLENNGGKLSFTVAFERTDRMDKPVILHLRTPEMTLDLPLTLHEGKAVGEVPVASERVL